MNRSFTSVFVALTILIATMCLPFSALGEEIPNVIKSATVHIQNEKFSKLTSLYLLPPHYSESQLIKEKKSIKNALELLSNEFGAVTEIERNQEEVRWISLEIFGGDIDFLKSKPNFYQYAFRVSFSKLGDGFIIIKTYPTSSDSKLRSIGYALPEAEKNIPILQSIGQKLNELMFPELTPEKI